MTSDQLGDVKQLLAVCERDDPMFYSFKMAPLLRMLVADSESVAAMSEAIVAAMEEVRYWHGGMLSEENNGWRRVYEKMQDALKKGKP